jgi:serine/threonine-protein phosphatase 2A regulatory subunit A
MRLFTASNLWLVAAAMGPDPTRSTLIPFLLNTNDFDCEVKAIIAKQLGSFVQYVGGSRYISVLLAPLRNLADSEDLFVRNQAIDSLISICLTIPRFQCDSIVTPLIQGLFQSTLTTSKVAACRIFPQLYDLTADHNRPTLRRAFLVCLKDPIPLVRRAALEAVPGLCNVVVQAVILTEIIRQGVQERLNDDDESIRVMIPECLPAIAARLGVGERARVVIPMARMLVNDSSWWVRRSMASSLPSLVPQFVSDFTGSDVGALILFLLRDIDPEVKTEACSGVAQIVDILIRESAYFNDSVLGDIIELSADKFNQVRETVATHLLVFARITGHAIAKEKIFPILLQLLADPERDVVIGALKGIRANFSSLDSYAVTSAVLPKLLEISKRVGFRVKIEIVRSFCLFVPYIALEALSCQIVPLILHWLQDSVYQVRKETAEAVARMIRIVEEPRVTNEILQTVTRLHYSPQFCVRQASLLVAWHVCEVLPSQMVTERVLASVVLLASDHVPNVRILVAKTMHKLKDHVDAKGAGQIERGLKVLMNDADVDVKYFAANPGADLEV